MRTWTGDRQKKEVISILEDDSMKGETPLADDRKFLDAVEYGISVPNWLAGVKNWKVEKLERHPLPNGHRIVLVGSYFNARNELIRFEEWKFFLKNGYGQINFSEASPAPLSRDRVREILQRYRPFGT